MKNKTLNDLSDLKMVFSTDPEAIPPKEPEPDQPAGTPYPKQTIRISLDRKHRAGKEVTLLEGFEMTVPELESMAKKLKSQCGIGGSIDQGLILLQGDQRKKLPALLQKMGFKKIRLIA